MTLCGWFRSKHLFSNVQFGYGSTQHKDAVFSLKVCLKSNLEMMLSESVFYFFYFSVLIIECNETSCEFSMELKDA